jgi:hypothetical protein
MTAKNVEELKQVKNIISKYRNKIQEADVGIKPIRINNMKRNSLK